MICTTTSQVVNTARDLSLKSTLIFFTSKDVHALIVIKYFKIKILDDPLELSSWEKIQHLS